MEKISKNEVQKMDFVSRGLHPENPVVTSCMQLNVGEYLFVNKDEWKLKSHICQALRDSSPVRKSRAKFITKMKGDRSGWVIKRIN